MRCGRPICATWGLVYELKPYGDGVPVQSTQGRSDARGRAPEGKKAGTSVSDEVEERTGTRACDAKRCAAAAARAARIKHGITQRCSE